MPKPPTNSTAIAGSSPVPGSEVFATALRNVTGMVITLEKGTRVRVTRQCEINGTCTVDLMEKDNPTRIWNTIVGVPMKYLQFDPQNVKDLARRALDTE